MSNASIQDKQDQARRKLITKLLPYVRKNGVHSLRMDEAAKIMGVSRATLYKYFSTKEDLISYVVEVMVQYIQEVTVSSDREKMFADRFQQIFEQSVLLLESITDTFLKELDLSSSGSGEQLRSAMRQWDRQVLEFYEEGIREGVFNPINGNLIVLQDRMLQSLLDVKYLMEHHLTVYEALFEYYQLKKYQLFKPDRLQTVDDTRIIPRIEYMAQKITQNLY
ncbi:TetR/AcrR family transcriptional regulator [Paenibacillus senegalimassiliensis]|uniref:TetR/AcrR family transcriptional regulator n=1 Tax=Paenibacillus senegalimassiliensis TaxID=1737426 RepID=UPI00073ED110|nr:TetR/AcrR family transcriptional regulator [Paenibacillus senegalimassiliensis]